MLSVIFKTFLGLGSIISVLVIFGIPLTNWENTRTMTFIGTYLGIFCFFLALITAIVQHVAKITRRSHKKKNEAAASPIRETDADCKNLIPRKASIMESCPETISRSNEEIKVEEDAGDALDQHNRCDIQAMINTE